jgi:hypothetical protein
MKNYIMLGCVGMLAACAEKVPPSAVMSQIEFDYKSKQVADQIDDMPKWYTNIPQKDDAVYAVGTAVTPDLQLSVDIATLAAKTTLADRIDSRLRSQLKTFKGKVGADDFDSKVTHEFEQATRNLIADADVAGYHVKESEIIQNGTQYRAYVLLEYTDLQAKKVMRNRLARNQMIMGKISATKAWDDLNSEVEKELNRQ